MVAERKVRVMLWILVFLKIYERQRLVGTNPANANELCKLELSRLGGPQAV